MKRTNRVRLQLLIALSLGVGCSVATMAGTYAAPNAGNPAALHAEGPDRSGEVVPVRAATAPAPPCRSDLAIVCRATA